MSETITGVWLSNKNDQKIAPKTYTGQVLSNDGTKTLDNVLSTKANASDIPTKVSQLTNDSGFTNNSGTVTHVKVGDSLYSQVDGVVSIPSYPISLPASDVSDWAKSDTKPTYTASEVGAATTEQGTKADSAIQTIKINNVEQTKTDGVINLPAYPTSLPASNVTDVYDVEDSSPVSSKAIEEALNSLPEPMVFKGSLGVDGTITELPSASSENTGYTYKVITEGTYDGKSARVGDTFISDGTEWTLIPSGDDPSGDGTVTSVGISVPTGLSVSGSPITTSGTIAITYDSDYSIPTNTKQSEWDSKQSALTEVQLSAVNSGITKDKVDSIPSSYAPTDAEKNVIDTIKVNNETVEVVNKAVNISVPTQASDINALPDTTTIPSALSDLTADSEHRVVTDTEKSTWNAKSDFSGSYNDLTNKPTIPDAVTESTVSDWGFTKNTGDYSKPENGIPKTDLSSSVQTSLSLADSALQSLPTASTTTLGGVKVDGTTVTISDGVISAAGGSGGDDKMDKGNPTGYGSFSLNRKENTTVGSYSFTEGYATTASEDYSHAEGFNTTASGYSSHAEGYDTEASGYSSHAEGYNTTASGDFSHAEGKYNIEDINNKYAHIVGNGTPSLCSNAYTLDWDGNGVYSGKVVGTNITSKGSSTQPVYFDANGIAKPTTYSLNATVPSDAVFTDTTYESKSASSQGTDVSLVTTGEKYTWNNKYDKPSTGIPKTDLASSVQTSLGKADTALQSYTEQYTGTVNSVKVGDTSYSQTGGVVSLPAYPTTLPASDVSDWAKATSKPSYTASEVGALSSTTTHLSGDIATSEKGANNGVATLGNDGKIPESQLPSFVSDIKEYDNKSSFPTTGQDGKIYVAKDTNLTYRWSGSAYVEVSPSIALGETSSTAYAGDKGKANADAISTHTGNSDIHVTSSDKTTWSGKQDALSSTQLSAVNSGITADKVSTYDGYASTIASKGTYSKPTDGIPKSDLDSDVQTSLGLADNSIQREKEEVSLASNVTADNEYITLNASLSEPSGDHDWVGSLKYGNFSSYHGEGSHKGWLFDDGIKISMNNNYNTIASYGTNTSSTKFKTGLEFSYPGPKGVIEYAGTATSLGEFSFNAPLEATAIKTTAGNDLDTVAGKLSDSGWKDVTFATNFTNYTSGGSAANGKVQYRKLNGAVYIQGVAKNTAQIASGTSTTIFTLPTGYRPSVDQHFICQGSSTNRFLLTASTTGTVTISRYGTTSDTTIVSGAWLCLQASFLVA